ncbi:MAG TPA: hypothetical protein VK773_02990 [Acidimicrobiales bacterium]|nr:hypothetical protein [Acidimicrobiales bacterium]
MPEVYLLTRGSEGAVAVPDLRLTFGRNGLELEKADGESVWECEWSDLLEMAPVERSVLPDGKDGIVMVVVERDRRRRHRFVLATDDPEATEDFIRGRAGSHGLRTRWPRPAVSRLLTLVIIAAFAVTMTLLLLSAVHVIRF